MKNVIFFDKMRRRRSLVENKLITDNILYEPMQAYVCKHCLITTPLELAKQYTDRIKYAILNNVKLNYLGSTFLENEIYYPQFMNLNYH